MGNDNSRGGVFGGIRHHEGAMGLGRGRMDEWQRGEESFRGARRIGPSGGGRGGIAGSGIGLLTLVEGAKKLLQDVSGEAFDGIPASLHDANVPTGCALPHDRTTTNRRADGSSNAACRVSRTDSSLIARAITEVAGSPRHGKTNTGI
jgi:hypothetical protein